jgi:hypothetical protein
MMPDTLGACELSEFAHGVPIVVDLFDDVQRQHGAEAAGIDGQIPRSWATRCRTREMLGVGEGDQRRIDYGSNHRRFVGLEPVGTVKSAEIRGKCAWSRGRGEDEVSRVRQADVDRRLLLQAGILVDIIAEGRTTARISYRSLVTIPPIQRARGHLSQNCCGGGGKCRI